MMLIDETPVPDTALPTAAFAAHLRLGTGFGQEDLQAEVLTEFLRAAICAVEGRTGKVLLARRFTWSAAYWADRAAQALPVAPVREVWSLVLVGQDGAQSLVTPEAYWLEQDRQRPRLRSTGPGLPRIPAGGTAQIELEAGFGAAWDEVPPDLRQAVMLLAAHYYEYRNDTGLSGGCMPFGVSSLIERYRSFRLGMGAVR